MNKLHYQIVKGQKGKFTMHQKNLIEETLAKYMENRNEVEKLLSYLFVTGWKYIPCDKANEKFNRYIVFEKKSKTANYRFAICHSPAVSSESDRPAHFKIELSRSLGEPHFITMEVPKNLNSFYNFYDLVK